MNEAKLNTGYDAEEPKSRFVGVFMMRMGLPWFM